MVRFPFRLLFAAAALAAVLPACDIRVDDGKVSLGVSRGRARDEWVRSYTLTKGGRFEIANENGEILVKGTQGSEVKLTAHREVSAGSDEEAQARLKNLKMREDVSGDRVVVEALNSAGEGFNMSHGLQVRYEVEVPDGLALTFKTMNGTVRLDNVDGKITAATTNGNVSGEGISGDVQGSTVNGSVALNLDEVKGDVHLTTVNGAIRLVLPATANADLDATTVNGGVSVDDRLGLADKSGNRSGFGQTTNVRGRLNKGGARVTLQTTNGGVRVAAQGTDNDDRDQSGLGLRGRRARPPRPPGSF